MGWGGGALGAEAPHCLGVQQSSGAAKPPPTMHEGNEAVGGTGRQVSDGTGCSSAAALVGRRAAEIAARHPSTSHLFLQHCVPTTAKVRRNVGALRRCLGKGGEGLARCGATFGHSWQYYHRHPMDPMAELQQARSISPTTCGNHPRSVDEVDLCFSISN